MDTPQGPGRIGWVDLTVADAEPIRDFYRDVVGWTASGLDMDGYQDFCMSPPGDDAPVAGVCHARGPNANLPPVWLVYVTVADLEQSLAKCKEHGGQILDGPRQVGGGAFAVIRDPAGAVLALFEPKPA